jgi:hypothetical protein
MDHRIGCQGVRQVGPLPCGVAGFQLGGALPPLDREVQAGGREDPAGWKGCQEGSPLGMGPWPGPFQSGTETDERFMVGWPLAEDGGWLARDWLAPITLTAIPSISHRSQRWGMGSGCGGRRGRGGLQARWLRWCRRRSWSGSPGGGLRGDGSGLGRYRLRGRRGGQLGGQRCLGKRSGVRSCESPGRPHDGRRLHGDRGGSGRRVGPGLRGGVGAARKADSWIGREWLEMEQGGCHAAATGRGLVSAPVLHLLEHGGIIGPAKDVDAAIALKHQGHGGGCANATGGYVHHPGRLNAGPACGG